MKKTKTSKQIERHTKGISNHRRIDILALIAENDEMTVEDIAEALKCNIKTISGHTLKLAHSGLVNKKYRGRKVLHSLSPYGKIFHGFLLTFSHS